MIKILIFLFILTISINPTQAKVEIRWFTVASVLIEDKETKIFFDPMFTRAKLKHFLNLSPLRSDESLVATVIKEHQLEGVNALFASHSHYDHVIDAPAIAKLTGATFYVDESSYRITKAYKDPKIVTKKIENLIPIKVGKFTITPIQRNHPHVDFLGIDFLYGMVREDFNFGFYEYRMGQTWMFYIEHPRGKILIDEGNRSFLNSIEIFTKGIDVLVQGVLNRDSDESILNGYIKALRPSIFIPIHFDNFFFPFDSKGGFSYFPGVKIDELMKNLRSAYPETKIMMPGYAQKITILE